MKFMKLYLDNKELLIYQSKIIPMFYETIVYYNKVMEHCFSKNNWKQ